ncbi:hypothetical protein BDL97_09G004100 [Sphagnum fallax]|nr:hypothetical protein BDL97_09G004100 [Sphagnum fallax]
MQIWRRGGKEVDKPTTEHLFEVINAREEVLRRLIRKCAYLKYILRGGFCINMIDTPLCPLKVVTNLQEAIWDADIVVNVLPSTETRPVFQQIGRFWRERRIMPVIISLAKGVEAALQPLECAVQFILFGFSGYDLSMRAEVLLFFLVLKVPILKSFFPRKSFDLVLAFLIMVAVGVLAENVLYLGGPNIAAEVYNREYANARICGSEKWKKPLAQFLRQPHFVVWDNSDLTTHEMMGGLKNVYAIGAGMAGALTNESATSKAVYFAHCTSKMIYITHLLAEQPERLAGPLLANTLLKGRNAWYGEKLAKGELKIEMGDNISGKRMIQGVLAVKAFHELLRQPSLSVMHPELNKPVAPVELCPILRALYKILIQRNVPPGAILQALRDENMYDPWHRIEMDAVYIPQLLRAEKEPPLKIVSNLGSKEFGSHPFRLSDTTQPHFTIEVI